jgi:hypothetical protein
LPNYWQVAYRNEKILMAATPDEEQGLVIFSGASSTRFPNHYSDGATFCFLTAVGKEEMLANGLNGAPVNALLNMRPVKGYAIRPSNVGDGWIALTYKIGPAAEDDSKEYAMHTARKMGWIGE